MFDILAKEMLINDNFEVTFDLLQGPHALEGVWSHTVDLGADFVLEYYHGNSTVNAFSILLDGVTFTAIEDPEDGYRSSFKEFLINKVEIVNTFKPIKVFIRIETEGDFSGIEILYKKSVICRIGTDYNDSYYPYFIGEWTPTENLKLESADEYFG